MHEHRDTWEGFIVYICKLKSRPPPLSAFGLDLLTPKPHGGNNHTRPKLKQSVCALLNNGPVTPFCMSQMQRGNTMTRHCT